MSVLPPARVYDLRNGKRVTLAELGDVVVSHELERVTQGASSLLLTVRDPQGVLMKRSSASIRGARVDAYGQSWVCVGESASEDKQLTLVFESEWVNRLRRDKRRLSLKSGTRPGFSKAIVSGAKLRLDMPDQAVLRAATRLPRGIGVGMRDRVMIAGKPATREQVLNLDLVMGAALDAGASLRTMRALVAAVLTDSRAVNRAASASSRGGVLEFPRGLATGLNTRSITDAATWFTRFVKPGVDAAGVAAATMRHERGRYVARAADAVRIVNLFMRDEQAVIAKAKALVRKHLTEKIALSVGAPSGEAGESRWDALDRVWTSIGWLVFEDAAGIMIVSGDYLRVAKPRVTLFPTMPGVVKRPSVEADDGFVVDTMTWQLEEQREGDIRAGMVVDVTDMGVANGRYYVSSERRRSGTRIVEVELSRPPVVVPAQNTSEGASATSINGAPDGVQRAYAKAREIGAKKYPYVFGGGHGSFSGPYDCSGFVSALLHAGGALSVPMATGGLSRLGLPGKGQYMTFYVKENGNARESHTYAVFNIGGKLEKWEAGGGGGVTGIRPGGVIERSGYAPRHIDGW